ncbi:MAG: tetratricopeptide repeat protein [Thermodesulfobacteriota bacterium]
MLESIQHTNHWTLRDIFLPRVTGGLYYRPLIGLSYMADKTFFHQNPFALHAENVLLHLANIFLVFFLISEFSAKTKHMASGFVALGGSLLFGLHPIVTESVNWISGRTDLLMGFFLLTSALLLARYRTTGNSYLPWLAAGAFLCALLAKELAIAFLPGYFFLLYTKQATHKTDGASLAKIFLIVGGVTLLVVGTFLTLRGIAFTSNSTRIGLTLQYMQINPGHSFFLFLGAIGFYFKKLLFPWPLNFAIVEIDPIYDLLAIPLIGCCLYIAWQRTLWATLFITGILLFTPALLIALNQIAWAPYAERYLYSTTAFVSIATILYWKERCLQRTRAWHYVIFTMLLALVGLTALHRNFVWQTNRAILADTAIKSPSFARIQWLYGAALFQAGDYEKALFYTKRAATLPSSPIFYDQIPEINLGHILRRLDRIPEAIATFEAVITKTSDSSPEAHEGLLECYRHLWQQADAPGKKHEYLQHMQRHGERLFSLRPDPLIYYNLGKMALASKEHHAARIFFALAADRMPPNHEFLPFARKLLLLHEAA